MAQLLAWITPDTIPDNKVCRVLRIPDSDEIIGAVEGALTWLSYSENWEKFGDVEPIDMAASMWDMYVSFTRELCMPIGSVTSWAGSTAPENWLLCDGSLYDVDDYPLLYAEIGNTFGGVSGETLAVPDARGRALVGADATNPLGTSFGAAGVALSVGELPAHTHSEVAVGTTAGFIGEIPVLVSAALPSTTGSTGGGGAHNNVPPSLSVHAIIKAK